MLDFELPLVSGNITIADAIAEAVESDKPGLLYEAQPGELRLIHYYGLIQAAKTLGSAPLGSVLFEPVVDIETIPDTQISSFLSNANKRFGFKGLQSPGIARLSSISESFGYPFAFSTPGRRCTRKNRPPHVAPRDWYHYPPENMDDDNPNYCAICGEPLQ